MSSKKRRKLVVGNEVWHWVVGGQGAFLWGPNRERLNVPMVTLTGVEQEDMLRAHEQGSTDLHFALTPTHIRRFLDARAAASRKVPPATP